MDIRALGRASLPLTRKRVLAMFSVYFDESGTHDGSPVVAVAGWVSTDAHWERFSRSWVAVLRAAKLDPPIFHMTDYESRRAAFSGWHQNKRVRVLKRLHDVIRSRTSQAIGVAVIVTAFEKGRREGKIAPDMSPYGFGVVECIKKVGQWADEVGHNEPIAYYFEDGNRWRSDVFTAAAAIQATPDFRARFRFGPWGLGYKDQMIPLQAADILAYEVLKETINGNLGTGDGRLRPVRKSLQAMTDMVPRFSYYDATAFDSAPRLCPSP